MKKSPDVRIVPGSMRRRGAALGRLACASVFALVATAAIEASAQVPTEAQPGVVDRPTPAPPVELRREPAQIERQVPRPEQVPGAEEVVATITKINFRGQGVVSEGDLQAAVAKYLNRPITRGELAQLKFDVQRLYYDRGYILVQVVTPPQDLSDGSLDVRVYEAVIGKIEVRNDKVLREWVVEALTQSVQEGTVFHERAVESMVNDFNDFNNVDATLNLRRGQQVGTSDLLLNLKRVREDEQSVSVSNHGSELTGSIVGTVNLEKSNLFGMGEKFDVDGIVTDERTYSVQGGFRVPVGFRNVMFDTRFIRSDIEIGDRLESLQAEGETEIFELGFSSKLINMRRQVAQLRAGFQMREHESFLVDVLSTKDDIRQVFVEGSYLARFPNLVMFGSLRLAHGIDVLGMSGQGGSLRTRALGEPEVLLVQPTVFATYRPIENGEMRATLSGQVADNTTLSSDLFILGGYGSVRGFEPAETTGEAGYQFSVEYNHTVWTADWQGGRWAAAVGPFVDGGHVWNRIDGAVQDSTLLAAGFGAQLQTGASGIGLSTLRLDLAVPLGGYTSQEVESTTVYFRLGQRF